VKTQGLFREIRSNLAVQGIGSQEFAELCAAESRLYAAITNLDRETLSEEAFPHVEGLVDYLESDRALPLLLSGIVCLKSTEFAKLAQAMVSVITRHAVLANLNPSLLEDALYSAARALRAKHEQGGSSRDCLTAAKDVLRGVNPTQAQIRSSMPEVFLTSAESGNLFGHHQRGFWSAPIIGIDPGFQFCRTQQPIGVRDGPLAMDPLRLDRVEPGAFGRQPTGDDPHALPGPFDSLVMGP
jgi:hypothetical protein